MKKRGKGGEGVRVTATIGVRVSEDSDYTDFSGYGEGKNDEGKEMDAMDRLADKVGSLRDDIATLAAEIKIMRYGIIIGMGLMIIAAIITLKLK